MAITLSQIAKVLNFITGIVLIVAGITWLIVTNDLGHHGWGFSIKGILIPLQTIFAGVIIIGFELKKRFFIDNFQFCYGYYGRAIFYLFFAILVYGPEVFFVIYFIELLVVAIIVFILALSGKTKEQIEASTPLIDPK